MIIFESIRWKNFLSTGDQWTEVILNDSPSTLIIGQNGAGKSTILDAICFGLFNKPFRKINKPQLVNSINEKGLKVEVCFTIGKDEYRVFRGIKPTVFELYKNNKLVDQDAATKDTQKYLEQSILKLNFKSFTQVVILGSSTFVPFMQLPAANRREVVEDLLDIGIFSSMNTLLKDKIREAQNGIRDCEHMLRLSEEKYAAQKKLLASLETISTQRLKEKESKVTDNHIKIDNNQIELCEKQKQLGMVEFDMTTYNDIKGSISTFKQNQAVKKSELNYAGADKGQVATNANIVIAPASLIEDQKRSKKIKIATTEKNTNVDPKDFSKGAELITMINTPESAYGDYLSRLDDNQVRKQLSGKNIYEVTIKNIGGLVMPVTIEWQFTDGSTETDRLPAEVWRSNEYEIKKTFIKAKEVQKVTLDPNFEFADTDTSNNSFPKIEHQSDFESFKHKQNTK